MFVRAVWRVKRLVDIKQTLREMDVPSTRDADLLGISGPDFSKYKLVNQGDFQMNIRNTFKKWAAYQQTVRELAALDNRQLNDLGISRTDINRVARDHVSSL